MQFTLDQSDFGELSTKAREEVVNLILRRTAPPAADELDERYRGIEMAGVVDLTADQFREFAKSVSVSTMHGLQAFAENGPVISVVTLNAALEEARVELGRDSAMASSQFQSRTTKRTRTVTGRGDVYLVGWNDWNLVETDDECLYAVTPTTYSSLKQYFSD